VAIVKVVEDERGTFVYHDDYCKDKTPEEIQAILDRIAAIAYPELRAAHFRKLEKQGSA
jgi:hypothetical protein